MSHSLKPLRLLALTRYGFLGASSRLRTCQYFPSFSAGDIDIHWHPFFDDNSLQLFYKTGRHSFWHLLKAYVSRIQVMLQSRNYDIVLIEKECLPFLPLELELALLAGTPFVLDFDDALFHNYDKHRSFLVRRLYSLRIDRLMAKAKLVLCGNHYLAHRARHARASWIELLPTCIDIERYRHTSLSYSAPCNRIFSIVWVGSPSTAKYLHLLETPLQTLAKTYNFVFRIIGAHYHIPGVQIEVHKWSERSEVELLSTSDVGVMPLVDSPWERGKCGYKLIQYMACALPVIASPVGANMDIVEHGINGYLVSTADDWILALQSLMTQLDLRRSMGAVGQFKVQSQYSIQKTAPRFIRLLRQAALSN
jgi:glycosyltransferase involved in cell wall biosynthesis